MVTNFPPKFRRSLGGAGWNLLYGGGWLVIASGLRFGKCSDAVFAGEIVCVDGPQFSSLASPLDLCYQRHFLKRAFRKTGRITK